MIQTIEEDQNKNTLMEFDREGLRAFINSLEELLDLPSGTVVGTPSVWKKTTPWWKFWDWKTTYSLGYFQIRMVREELFSRK